LPQRHGLSKSRIALYEQCPRRLWLAVHRPELAQETAAVTASFAAGHEVGAIACALHPDGHMINEAHSLSAAIDETSALLTSGWDKPIFEASFVHDDVVVRVDLMLPTSGGWHVAEVKSTSSAKPYQLSDLATQLWVLREAGVPVASASIRHLDGSFTLSREDDYAGLFADHMVHDTLEPLIAERPRLVAEARAMLDGEEPEREIGAHCNDPFTCAFQHHCGQHLPPGPEWPSSILPDISGKKVAAHYAAQGIDDLTLIPASAMISPKLARVHAATVSGETWHDAAAIRAETDKWPYPHIYLDFETIAFAVPRWIGTRPWQQVPFQFSALVVHEDGTPEQHDYLSLDGSDPRRGCAEALALLPAAGAVIAWNASFERTCLNRLAARFADLAPALTRLAARLVDLLPVVRNHFYHRDQRGSWSIKAVLPTIAPELGYEGLVEIKSGTDAQSGYLEAVHPDTTAQRRTAIEAALLSYCRRDVEAMRVVLDRLGSAAGAS